MNRETLYLYDVSENNLKHIDVEIPKHTLTVFTGVSGSGKSSLVFDTIAAEARRQLNETYSAYLRNQMPQLPRPHVKEIINLSPAIVIGQKKLGGNCRSTVGTVTDIQPLLRLLFSRIGSPYAGSAGSFSFNDPAGACPVCNGLGHTTVLREDMLLDESKSLNTGAILFPLFPVGSWYWRTYVLSGLFDNDKPVYAYTDAEKQALLYGKADTMVDLPSKSGPFRFAYEGLTEKITRLFIQRAQSNISQRVQDKIAPFLTSGKCSACGGSRYAPRVLACKINGYNLADYCAMDILQLLEVVRAVTEPKVATVTQAVISRLSQLADMGLGYLQLGRETQTLSGGESQRIKMVTQLNSSLSDMLYIFDEPSTGMHTQDLHTLTSLLYRLRDKGNTVLVVEHNRSIINAADYCIDIGPAAGVHGGEITFTGSAKALAHSPCLTGQALRAGLPMPSNVRTGKTFLSVTTHGENNLKPFTVQIPEKVYTVIAGVAGSGKSTLMRKVFLRKYPQAILIDQSPIGISARSTPATYTKMFDSIRKLFAAANKVSASVFSFNANGACPHCHGLGFTYTDLAFMEPVRTTCSACSGHRYKPECLALQYNGKSIDDVLNMTVDEAESFFTDSKLLQTLHLMQELGLGYMTLGQPLSSLSGGECQRIKLVCELQKKGRIFVMDEPTTGLHMTEVAKLRNIINRLLQEGNTVIVVEHDEEMIAAADWVIELGPGGGKNGGEVIFTGTPASLAGSNTPTGRALHALIEKQP